MYSVDQIPTNREATMSGSKHQRWATLVLLAAALAWVSSASSASGTAVSWRKTSIGNAITTASGLTLYLFRGDSGSTSKCYGACASAWPPLITSGKPTALGRVDASLLGTTKRTDGKLQVTFKDHPLYTFVGDKAPGQTHGEGSNAFGAQWYALAPSNGATIDKD
jgi:predicted lipoprotein with Yx(FWY)xxD motif